MKLQDLCNLVTQLVLLLLLSSSSVVVFGLENYSRADFPANFVFGSGTSAYQVEGAAFEDGRTPSIWDTFAHEGNYDGATGDTACDAYHKYKEDVQLMVDTGLEAYRFSISWSRLIPNGKGPVNPKALEYYNNLINELIAHGIQPHVTLFHSDLPQALEDEYGGWLDRKIIKDFTTYADVCFKEFGDRILYWTTLNEANVFALGGYDIGVTPPGRCSSPFGARCNSGGNSTIEQYIVAHNMLLTHASIVTLYKNKYKSIQQGFLGINVYTMKFVPNTNTTADAMAAERAFQFYTGWFINPVIFGDYPEIMKKNAGTRIPIFTKDESEQVKGSVDFIGINHYFPSLVKDKSDSLFNGYRDFNGDMAAQVIYDIGHTLSIPYEVRPSDLYEVLEQLKQNYGNPTLFVHENGQRLPRNQTLIDTVRIDYVRAYIGSVLRALRNGSDIRGYFMWSFLDGLELLGGYYSSYGLYYVDLNDKDLKRYRKLSAVWYSNFLKGIGSSKASSDIVSNTELRSKFLFSQ